MTHFTVSAGSIDSNDDLEQSGFEPLGLTYDSGHNALIHQWTLPIGNGAPCGSG